MAEYYIAPKSSFDATADAIREKTGSQATIEWTEDGFADAIAAIPSGGTDYLDLLLKKTITSYENSEVTQLVTAQTFQQQPNLVSVSFPNVTEINAQRIFYQSTALTSVNFPKLGYLNGATECFRGCTGLTIVVLPSLYRTFQAGIFHDCTNLTIFDSGIPTAPTGNFNMFGQSFFNGDSALHTIILRTTNRICGLGNINTFNNTKFASGGVGGTIYIPKVLYDHLGDDTSLDYKAATNWSTIDGYGTITWAKIEGSQYENYYADGTPIPTT